MAWVKENRLFAVLLLFALALRATATAAYHPGLFFLGDSVAYIDNAFHLVPEGIHPIGYPVLIRMVLVFHDLTLVAVVQHLLGLGTAVLSYGILRRLKIPKAAAVAATLFVLFDPL